MKRLIKKILKEEFENNSKINEKLMSVLDQYGLIRGLELLNINIDKLSDVAGISVPDLIKHTVTKICNELISGLYNNIIVDDYKVIIKMKGEETYKYNFIKPIIRKELPAKYSSVKLEFEKKFYADVEYDEDSVTLTKELDNGEIFELTGTLSEYNSGRAIEYEFEPDYYSNDEYYDENWEIIEKYIIDNIPY